MTNTRVWGLAALVVTMIGCAEAPVTELRSTRSAASDDSDDTDEPKAKTTRSSRSSDEDDSDVSDDESATDDAPVKPSSGTPAQSSTKDKPPLAIDISFAGSLGQTFGAVPIHRACSDMGADYNQATVVDGTSLQLVDVNTKKAVVTVQGADLKAIQNSLANGDGKLHIAIPDAKTLPAQSTEYAIIMGGDSRFGSPAKCGVDIAPHSDQDRGIKGSAGQFPTGREIVFTRAVAGDGCGIVGFLQAYYDEGKGQIIARPSSPIVIAGDDEGRAGFPKGNNYPGCDVHASPLVLDLSGRGVSLTAARPDLFDIDGNGSRDAVSWIASNDTPFLVRDVNGNNQVDGATELFGNYTDKSSRNGFEALGHIDENGDGVIDSHDSAWSTLRLWFDRDRDGRTGPGELETLDSRGISSIATAYVTSSQRLLGGSIRQRGAATSSDGRSIPVLDVWFDRQF